MDLIEKEEILTNRDLWFCCLDIVKFKDKFLRRELADHLRQLDTSKKFYDLLIFLENNGFITCDKARIPYRYELKRNKLAKFLWKSQIIEEDFKYLQELTSFWRFE